MSSDPSDFKNFSPTAANLDPAVEIESPKNFYGPAANPAPPYSPATGASAAQPEPVAAAEDAPGLQRLAFERHVQRNADGKSLPAPPGYVIGPEHYGEIAYKFIESHFAGSAGLLNAIKDEVTGAKAAREAKENDA